MLAFSHEHRGYCQMQFVNLTGQQVLANNGNATADSDVLSFGSLSSYLQRGFCTLSDEVERGAAFHHQWGPRVMGKDIDRRVIWRIVAPPPFPGTILPWTADRTKHISA